MRALARAMKRDRIDLVHTHLFGDSLHGYLAARSAGALPVVMTLHCDFEFENPLQRLGYRWLVPRCTRTVACSHFVRSSFLAADGRWEPRLLTIQNGIEPPVAAPDPGLRSALAREFDFDPRGPLIASIGRLAEQKCLDDLIRALAQIVPGMDPAPTLLLLGEGPLRGKLEEQARDAGLAERVRFAGFRPDVTRLLPAIDVVAFSSSWEGLSVAMLEAMAAGRCIVGTEVPGILEAVRHEREALIVPVGDVDRLAAALKRVASSPEKRLELGGAARTRFLEHFTAE